MQIYCAQCYAWKGEGRNVEYLQVIPEFDPKCVNTSLGVYAFQLFKKDETVIDGKIIAGETSEHTGYFYPNGKIYTLEELKSQFLQDIAFYEYVEKRGWSHVVLTRAGIWRPFNEERDQIFTITRLEREEPLNGGSGSQEFEMQELGPIPGINTKQNEESETQPIQEQMGMISKLLTKLQKWWHSLFYTSSKQTATST